MRGNLPAVAAGVIMEYVRNLFADTLIEEAPIIDSR